MKKRNYHRKKEIQRSSRHKILALGKLALLKNDTKDIETAIKIEEILKEVSKIK